jgi:hypothetical protein
MRRLPTCSTAPLDDRSGGQRNGLLKPGQGVHISPNGVPRLTEGTAAAKVLVVRLNGKDKPVMVRSSVSFRGARGAAAGRRKGTFADAAKQLDGHDFLPCRGCPSQR